MALTYRFYRSAEIEGVIAGTRSNSLRLYIPSTAGGADFWDWSHEIRPIRYSLARAESSVHALCAADAGITAYSPELADLAAVHAWLDSPLSSVPQSIRDQLESDGFSTSWANARTTRREAFIYISRTLAMIQELRRLRDTDAMELFNRTLDSTVGALPVLVRQKVAAWMQNRGLDTSWITGPTPVRAVIQYIHDNVWRAPMSFGPVKL